MRSIDEQESAVVPLPSIASLKEIPLITEIGEPKLVKNL